MPLYTIFYFFLTSLAAYLFSLTAYTDFLPQLIAILAIVTIFIKNTPYFTYHISLIVNIIIFATGGLQSPVFFLTHFLLLVIAFQNIPSVSFAYSLVLIFLLAQSLNSPLSLIPLASLALIAPLAWFIGQNRQQIISDESNFFLWLSLKFKTGVTKIIDSSSLLLSRPNLPYSDKQELHAIKSSAKNLLNSANRLLNSSPNDET